MVIKFHFIIFFRTNPSAAEFRVSFRDVFIDSIMASSEGKNYKDDLDSFLFSLDSIKSVGSNFSIEANIKSTVPFPIGSMMRSQITLSLKEQNVLMYIGGYIVKKQEHLYCSQCVSRLTKKKRHEF